MKTTLFAWLFAAFALAAAAGTPAAETAGNRDAGITAARGIIKRAERTDGNRGSALILYIEDPSGKPIRLLHVQGEGWKYDEGFKTAVETGDSLTVRGGRSTTRKVQESVASTDELLAVFVDGPSCFAYGWIGGQGWKFIGRLSDGAP